MTDAENVMEKASTNEHKGNYGQTNGRSANALYKSYKAYVENQGKRPLGFVQWAEWAKQKGVIKGNYSADAVTEENVPLSNIKKYAGVVFVVIAVIVLYKAYKSEQK